MTRTTYYMASTDPEAPNTYSQAAHARERSLYLPNGIYDGVGANLAIAATDPTTMAVSVDTGAITINGYTCECTALETLAIAAAHATLPRIDRVVARLDVAVTPGISFAILTGASASSPVVPTLTQTAYIYEVALAQIEVAGGVTSITTEDIIDERVYGDVTNLFHAAVEMLSDLTVAGNLSVAGNVSLGSTLTADIIGSLTGSATQFGGLTPALYAAALKCVIHSSTATSSAYTTWLSGSWGMMFPAPLKTATLISVYGGGSNNTLQAMMPGGNRETIAAWSSEGTRSGTVPAGAIGIFAGSAAGLAVNLYFDLTV